MCKRILVLALVLSISVVSITAYAGDKNALTKLGRGLANMGTAIVEIPKQTYRQVRDYPDPVTGSIYGFAKGIGYGLLRFGSGALDTVACVFPPYDQPHMQPEFVFEGWDE